MRRARAISLACSLSLAACAAERVPDPRLVAMVPSAGSGLAQLAVEIHGIGLDPSVRVDLGDEGGSAMNARFAARLAPCDGGPNVALEQVRLVSRDRLAAVVPPGGAPGRYDLTVVAPDGRELRLPDAFALGPSAEDVVGFRFEPIGDQQAGAPFPVTISAVDALGRVVETFGGSAAVQDLTGTASFSSLGPFVLGTLRAWLAVGTPAQPDRLSATDSGGCSGASNDFAVLPGPAAALVFAVPFAAAASACTRADLELRDAGGFATAAPQDVAVRLDAAPPGALRFYSDAACTAPATSLSVAAGATGAAFHVRGAASGSAVIRLVPDSLPTLEQPVEVAP